MDFDQTNKTKLEDSINIEKEIYSDESSGEIEEKVTKNSKKLYTIQPKLKLLNVQKKTPTKKPRKYLV